jgi:hypothetical protein
LLLLLLLFLFLFLLLWKSASPVFKVLRLNFYAGVTHEKSSILSAFCLHLQILQVARFIS